VNLIKNKGFTIIEAIVSLALFAIAFSGLYFFFGMAHQAYNNSEKRMHLNLMANHILDTIHAEAYRSDADVANPFVTPASYNANLSDCSTYTAPDVRHTWCTELDASVGPHKGVHADEVRTVEVVKDEAYLIADVTLVIDAGIGEKNLIKTFLSRKIAAPRRSTPYEACVERHNNVVAYIKSEKANCDAGTVPFITITRSGSFPPALPFSYDVKISCPDYKFMPASGASTYYPGGVGSSVLSGSWTHILSGLFFSNYVWQNYRNYPEVNTIYGEGYPWKDILQGIPGTIGLKNGMEASDFCTDDGTIESMYLPKVVCHLTWPMKPMVNVFSCCPKDTDINSSGLSTPGFTDGTYKKCAARALATPKWYVPFIAEGIDFTTSRK